MASPVGHSHFAAGRIALKTFGASSKHDLYAAAVGVYTVWGASLAAFQMKKLSGKMAVLHALTSTCSVMDISPAGLGLQAPGLELAAGFLSLHSTRHMISVDVPFSCLEPRRSAQALILS